MAMIPDFILRKMFVNASLKTGDAGLSFSLKNTFAPATLHGFMLDINRKSVPLSSLSIEAAEWEERTAADVTPQNPYPLPVNTLVNVRVKDCRVKVSRITVIIITREVGELKFTIKPKEREKKIKPKEFRKRFLSSGSFKSDAELEPDDFTGIVSPLIFGHYLQHVDNCVYRGIWNEEGILSEGVVDLIRELKPAYLRYPGGNFASSYHWKDGVGAKKTRRRKFDRAWNEWESNLVGTDEYLSLCKTVGAAPFVVVNDGSGTPEEAADWVSYCNEAETGEWGRQRSKNGHPVPYGVRFWGVGNEVFRSWQIGNVDAGAYSERLRAFAEKMRTADPGISIVAAGQLMLSDSAADRGYQWNDTLLKEASDFLTTFRFTSIIETRVSGNHTTRKIFTKQ